VDLDGRLDGELETVVYRVDLCIRDDGVGFQAREGAGVTVRAMFRVPAGRLTPAGPDGLVG
jgi:hypothetical protein